ncbi:MAG TPA: hypothetical protein VL020_04330 [Pseudomonadales bacterium]|nr:hypothetical protein [Desulfuromonadaceae bacterium]HUH57726.1 hypothetical protein [Pseudomonadales bacterium]
MKFILKTVIALFVLVVIAFGVGIYYIDSIAKKAIEYGGTEALGVNTSLGSIDIALMDGRTSMQNLNIANPQGFDAPHLLQLGKGTLAINLQSLTQDTIIIPEISFADLTLNIEQKDRTSNVKKLMDGMGTKTPSDTDKADKRGTQDGDSSTAAKQFIIKRVVLNNIKVNAKISAMNNVLTNASVTIPSIQLKDIGQSSDGLPLEAIIKELVNAILNASINNSGTLSSSLSGLLEGKAINIDSFKQNISDQVQQKAGAEIDRAKQKLLQGTQLPEGDNKLLNQQTDEAVNKLKGLFNKE